MQLRHTILALLATLTWSANAFCMEEVLLNGPWDFAYTPEAVPARVAPRFAVALMKEPNPQLPASDQFALQLEVPGYWDEQLSYIPEAPWGGAVRYNEENAHPIHFPYPLSGRPRHRHSGYPYARGVGWYRKYIEVSDAWRGRTVMAHVGGARVAAYIYVNGIFMDQHMGHGVPFEFDLTDELDYGQKNEIILAVSNDVDYIHSCALRGYAGMSGGITGDVLLRVSGGPGRIASYYAWPEDKRRRLQWTADLTSPYGLSESTRLHWAIKTQAGDVVQEGRVPVRPLGAHEIYRANWSCATEGVEAWSVWDPVLHRLELQWEHEDGRLIDAASRRFGLRQLERRGTGLFLNDRPIMLRGHCDIYHFAPHIHPPNDVAYFRRYLSRLKEAGFNYVRCHTWAPMKPYLEAADEVGMLLSLEHSSQRNDHDEIRWEKMVRWTRHHPSVIRYSGGNEEVGHEGLIALFARRYRAAKALAPDILITPMHTISGPETRHDRDDLPLPPHIAEADEDAYYERLWARITRYADIFAARADNFSYANFSGLDWREVKPEFTHFERPILAHETGIIGTYLDLSLESRYTETMPGHLYKAAREYITAAGRLHMAPVYFENSARWHGQARKFVLENLRKSGVFDGYDLLGGIDSHWHHSGYGCGVFNEFLELKPGDTLERILQYNGESVVLLDNARQFVFRCGDLFDAPVMASLFGGVDLGDGHLSWSLRRNNATLKSGDLDRLAAPDGATSVLGNIRFTWPELDAAQHLVLEARLVGTGYNLSNHWDFWVFPEQQAPRVDAAADDQALALLSAHYGAIQAIAQAPETALRVVRELTEDDVNHLERGGDVLLLGAKPFPANETRFIIGVAGRAHMNLATVINEHPALQHLPHDNWCDWQFRSLLEHGQAVEFNKFPAEFDPIVEVVSSYKYIRLQAALWETQTEGGRLFVAGFNFDLEDPAATALLDGVLEYVQSEAFRPTVTMSIEDVVRPLLAGVRFKSLRGNDGNFYGGFIPD